MAATGAPIRVPVAVACRVLKLSTQGYYKWLKGPVSQRDYDDAHVIDALREIHSDDPTLGYRFLTDELEDEHGIVASENRVHRLCKIAGIHACHAKRKGKAGKPGPPVHDDLLAVVDDKGRTRHDFTASRIDADADSARTACVANSTAPPPPPGSDTSHLTNCVTPTPPSWSTRAYPSKPSWSSWATPQPR